MSDDFDTVSTAGPGVPLTDTFVDGLRARGLVCDDEDVAVLFDRLAFIQARCGYRFGIDSVVLARFAASACPSAASVLDIGAGCGVVGILVAEAIPSARVTAVEIQPDMADRTRRNALLNRLGDRFEVVDGDISVFAGFGRRFDLIVSNPPFYRKGSGRVNPDGERALARHELRLNMDGLLAALSSLLSPGGTAVVLYPAERSEECLNSCRTHGLASSLLVPLLPGPGLPPESFLISITRADGEPAGPVAAEPMLLCRS